MLNSKNLQLNKMYFAGTDAQLLDSKDFAIQDYISMNSPIEMHGHPLFQMLNSVVALSLESFTLTQCKVGNRIHRSYIQSVPKKMSFLGKIAITTFKLIQNAKAGGVLENSGYLLPDLH